MRERRTHNRGTKKKVFLSPLDLRHFPPPPLLEGRLGVSAPPPLFQVLVVLLARFLVLWRRCAILQGEEILVLAGVAAVVAVAKAAWVGKGDDFEMGIDTK